LRTVKTTVAFNHAKINYVLRFFHTVYFQ
jgi:hypothetical protein